MENNTPKNNAHSQKGEYRLPNPATANQKPSVDLRNEIKKGAESVTSKVSSKNK